MHAAPQDAVEDLSSTNFEGFGDSASDMMAADRVMGVDEGKDAFHDMEAAVKSADERVSGVDKELESALKDAVGIIICILV